MKFLIPCIFVIILVVRAEFPASIPKCKNADNACLAKVTSEVIQKYSSGLRDINLLPLDPLHVKKMVLERNPSSPVNIDISFSDFDIIGFKDIQISSFSGLNADLSGRTVFEGKLAEVRLVGPYKVDGRVLILPVVGEGNCEVIFKNVGIKFSYDLKPVEKNGQVYVSLEHVKFDMQPEHAHYQFDNLFNGDKVLGDNLNIFINENWRDIFDEIKPSLTKAVGLVLKGTINNVFEKYPYAEYFQ